MLMVISIKNVPSDRPQIVCKRSVLINLTANGQRIDAIANKIVLPNHRLTGGRRTDHYLPGLTLPMDHDHEGGEKQRKHRATMFGSPRFEFAQQCAGEHQPFKLSVMSLQPWSRKISSEIYYRDAVRELIQPISARAIHLSAALIL